MAVLDADLMQSTGFYLDERFAVAMKHIHIHSIDRNDEVGHHIDTLNQREKRR